VLLKQDGPGILVDDDGMFGAELDSVRLHGERHEDRKQKGTRHLVLLNLYVEQQY
jgi:hypothetical protein